MLQQIMEREQQREADMRLQAAVSGLKQQYQIGDEQVRAVVGKALEMGVGPEMFPMIYESMAYQMQTQAQTQHTAAQEAEANRKRQEAANASRVVGGGASVPAANQVAAEQNTVKSPRDAVLAALNELGVE